MDERLIFRLGTSEWALPAEHVLQVLPPRPVTRVPDSTPPLCGLIAWRARVLPVLALGERLGCSDPPVDRCSLLVVEAGGGLIVLAVDEVVRLQPGEGETPKAQLIDLEQVLGE